VLDGADGSTFVLDAGALVRLDEIVEPLRRQGGRVVITPQTGEMATLLGVPRPAVLAHLLGSARAERRHHLYRKPAGRGLVLR
jgi:NAD(P)H-hydrate repair Nnr-like enzyme with NAD(P)H-hydrate dehydratase domain